MTMRSGILTDSMIKQMVADYLASGLEATEQMRYAASSANGKQLSSLTSSPEGVDIVAQAFKIAAEGMQLDLATGAVANAPWIIEAVNRMLEKEGISLQPESDMFQKLCRELLKTDIRQYKIDAERTRGDYDSGIEHAATLAALPQQVGLVETKPRQKQTLLSDVVKLLLDEKVMNGEANSDTIKRYRQTYAVLYELIGDRDIRSYTHQELLDARNKLVKLPANRNKSARYRKLSIAQLLEMDIPKPMDKGTAKTYIGRIISVFAYAEKHHFIDRDVGKGLEIKETALEKAKKKRKKYSEEEVHRIFNFLPFKKKWPYLAWLPLLAAYTGARQGELCQLILSDVRIDDDIHYLDILTEFDDEDDRTVKNMASRRKIPLHPDLVYIGFPLFVEKLRQKKSKEVFGVDAQYYSKRFQDFNRKKITMERTKVFHSFRHNFQDGLKQAGVPKDVYHEIVGHASSGEKTDRMDKVYTEQFNLRLKYEAVQKLSYNLDLDKLRHKFSIFL